MIILVHEIPSMRYEGKPNYLRQTDGRTDRQTDGRTERRTDRQCEL